VLPPKHHTPGVPLTTPTAALPAPPDPNDPLVRRYAEVAALVEPMFSAIDVLPESFRERVAMRVVAMAAQNELSQLRRSLPVSNFGARSILFRKLEEIAQQFAGLHASAQIIAGNYASYAQLIEQLRTDAPLLRQDLDALAQEDAYPLAWPRTGPISLQAIRMITLLAQPAQLNSDDVLKEQFRRARGLLKDIEAGQRAIAAAHAQRTKLLAILESPELTEQPEWHRAIMLLSQRSRAVGAPAGDNDDHQMTALRHDADSLLERRRALFVGMDPVAIRGYRLDEGRLEAIVDEGAAIQRDVRALWQRARALAAASRT
jgi:hypothetical protein